MLDSWKVFLNRLEQEKGHKKAVLIMHTDPNDPEGPNLLAVSEQLGLQDNVWFSNQRLQFNEMNILHNITDCCVNVSKNEGFGLSTMISMMCGKPIIALKTGGMTRQVVDHRDGTEHGVGLEAVKRSLVGSQLVPYIYEDYFGTQELASAFRKIHDLSPEEKKQLAEKNIAYVDSEFNFETIVKQWDDTLEKTIEKFKNKSNKKWKLKKLTPILPSVQNKPVQNSSKSVTIDQNLIDLDKNIRAGFTAKKIERKAK